MKETILGKKYEVGEMPDGKIWMVENLNYVCPEILAKNEYGCYYDRETAQKIGKEAKGWHLPTADEFKKLYNSFKSHHDFINDFLKEFDFSGCSNPYGYISGLRSYGCFWIRTSCSKTGFQKLNFNLSDAEFDCTDSKDYGFTVRLVKDKKMKKTEQERKKEFDSMLQDDLYLRYMIADFYGASRKDVDNLINEIIKKRKKGEK